MNEYDEDKLKLRERTLLILLNEFGKDLDSSRKSKYTSQSIYACADEWCKKQETTQGIVKYYKAYYGNK